MKRALLGIAGCAALAFAGFALAGGTVVNLGSTGPLPATVTVPWGETVTFTNSDALAQVVELPRDAITSPAIPPGGTFEIALTGRGGNHQFRVTGGTLDRPRSGVIVVDAEGTVTLRASQKTAAFNESVTLSGTSSFTNRPVTVQARSLTAEDWVGIAELTADEDGSFSTSVTPEPGARYRALTAGGSVVSAAIGIGVRPELRLKASRTRAAAGTTIRLIARARPAEAVRQVALERFEPRGKRWTLISRKRLKKGVATFEYQVPDGATRLRASVRRFTVARGYEAATSRVTIVRGT